MQAGVNRCQQATEAIDLPSLVGRRTGLRTVPRVQAFKGRRSYPRPRGALCLNLLANHLALSSPDKLVAPSLRSRDPVPSRLSIHKIEPVSTRGFQPESAIQIHVVLCSATLRDSSSIICIASWFRIVVRMVSMATPIGSRRSLPSVKANRSWPSLMTSFFDS